MGGDLTAATHADWLARADAIRMPHGTQRDTGATFAVVSPRDGQLIARVPAADESDVDRAVAAARRAFDEGPWPLMAPGQRRSTLLRLADLMETHRTELALLVSLEMGKPVSIAHGVELRAAIGCLRWYAELADKLVDEAPQ